MEKRKRKRIPYVPHHNLILNKKDIKPPSIISNYVKPNEQEIKKIIRELIRQEAREEALLILSKASDSQIKEFMTYYKDGRDVVCPMILDTIKIKLVESGEMTMGVDDWFGKPMWEDDEKTKLAQ
jgi:hypothetical protein